MHSAYRTSKLSPTYPYILLLVHVKMPESVKINQTIGNGSIIADPQTLKSEKPKSQQVFNREARYGAHNYEPIPVALTRGQGNITNFVYFCPIFYFIWYKL